jgi:hypothetical protein
MENEEDIATMSNTDTLSWCHCLPKTDKLEPKRAKLRQEKELANVATSKILTEEPHLVHPNTLTALPIRDKLRIDNAEPK